MLNKKSLKLSKYQQISIIILGMMFGGISTAIAKNLDADFVLNKMTSDQQVSYVEGVIEGLAFSRWLRDKPDRKGIQCIYKWADRKDKWKLIETFFGRHPDKQPGPLMYILIKQDCGA